MEVRWLLEGFTSWNYTTPGVSFKLSRGRITIFKTTLDTLGRPEYFQFMFSPEDKMFAIQACEMGDDGAHRMPEITSREYIDVNSKALVRFVYHTCGWKEKYTYRIPGIVHLEQRLISFDLLKALEIHDGKLMEAK